MVDRAQRCGCHLLDSRFGRADLLIVDEAHRAAGATPEQSAERKLGDLVTGSFPARLRLFATATPKVVTTRQSRGGFDDDAETVVVLSMDDDPDGPFGPVAHRLSFADAIARGLIVPYDVVIQVTSSEETASLLAINERIDAGDGTGISATEAATHGGLIAPPPSTASIGSSRSTAALRTPNGSPRSSRR